MDLHYKQEVAVGGLVIVALAIMFVGLAWLSGRDIFGGQTFRFGVRYENVAGLASGDPVMVSGVRVGRVAGFELRGVNDVVVFLEVSGRMAPKVDAEAQVKAIDMLGAMYVDYRPGSAGEAIAEGTIIDGSRDEPVLEVAGALADRAGNVLSGAEELLSAQTAADVRATLAATRQAMEVIRSIGTGPTVRTLNRTLEALASTAARMDSTLASPDLARSVAQLDEITDGLNDMARGLATTTQSLGQIMRRIESDSGTFGRLVNDTTLYHEILRLTISMRMLLDDMRERPGRYFELKVF